MARGLRDQPLDRTRGHCKFHLGFAVLTPVESRVLDAFGSGSGAMGFELLSRGALYATFVDKDRKTCDRIKRTWLNPLRKHSEMSVILW